MQRTVTIRDNNTIALAPVTSPLRPHPLPPPPPPPPNAHTRNSNTYTPTELRRLNEIMVNAMGRMNSHVLQTMAPHNVASANTNQLHTSSELRSSAGYSSGNGSPRGDSQNGFKYSKLVAHDGDRESMRESMGYDPPIPDKSLDAQEFR